MYQHEVVPLESHNEQSSGQVRTNTYMYMYIVYCIKYSHNNIIMMRMDHDMLT